MKSSRGGDVVADGYDPEPLAAWGPVARDGDLAEATVDRLPEGGTASACGVAPTGPGTSTRRA